MLAPAPFFGALRACGYPRAGASLDQPIATLLVGTLSSAVTVGGWIVLHYFTVRREADARNDAREKELVGRLAADARADRIKRLEILLRQTEAKISEFYGPLNGLIHQIWATWEAKQTMKGVLDSDTYAKVDHYIGEKYFAALHEQVRSIIREKLHLVEGTTMPRSFYEYTKHSMMENIQISLWNERGIDTSRVSGIRWPAEFPKDVEAGLQAAMNRYEELLAELRATSK